MDFIEQTRMIYVISDLFFVVFSPFFYERYLITPVQKALLKLNQIDVLYNPAQMG